MRAQRHEAVTAARGKPHTLRRGRNRRCALPRVRMIAGLRVVARAHRPRIQDALARRRVARVRCGAGHRNLQGSPRASDTVHADQPLIV